MVFLCFTDCVGKGIKSHWWGAKCRRCKNVIGVKRTELTFHKLIGRTLQDVDLKIPAIVFE